MSSTPLHAFKGHLKLISDQSELEVLESVRVVPGKRLVCRGSWAGQPVYAKIFFGKNAERYAVRDMAGVNALQRAGIHSPELLQFSKLESVDGYVLIFSEIKNGNNAEQIWPTLSDEARYDLAQKLVKTLALHHRAGLIQTDLYLKNFFVADNVVYSLDGDGIRQLSKVFRGNQELSNLATLFSKMDVLDDVWVQRLYQLYCQHSDTKWSGCGALRIQYLTQRIRHRVTCGYADKKVFRTCTDVNVTQSFRSFEAIASAFSIESQSLLSLDQFLKDTQQNIKNGNTCTIAKALLAGKHVVIKRYNIKNFWHGLNRVFRPSRAAKSWANAHRLVISNIATAKPLALVEERFGCLRRRAYYLSEFIDAPDALQFFAQATKLEDKKNVASNLAILFYKLYLLKFSHGDCKATNIKIVNLVPVLIDLDGMQAHFGGIFSDWWFERKHIKDLKRLMKNWENDTEVTALLKQAFMLEYTAVNPNVHHDILFRAGIA